MSRLEDRFAAAWLRDYPALLFEREIVISPWHVWSAEKKLLGLSTRRMAYRADFAWIAARVVVEVQGGIWKAGGHSSGSGINRDCAKTVVAQCAGWAVLPITDRMLSGKQQQIWLPKIANLIRRRLEDVPCPA
jgi:very-short-patch-repair endonuclease